MPGSTHERERLSYAILSGPDGLEQARASWTELERRDGVSYFQTYALARAWYETLGARVDADPRIVVLHDGDVPVGLFPGCVTRVRGVRMLTWMGLPDALDSADVLFDPEHTHVSASEFVHEALARLRRANPFRPLLLSNVRADAIAYPALKATLNSYNHGVIPEITANCTPESYDQKLSKGHRKTVRRRVNALTRDGGFRIEDTALGDEASFELLRHLCDLKVRQRELAGLPVDLIGEEYIAFIRRQTELGTAGAISTLVFDGKVIAGLYDVIRGASRYGVLLAYDPDYATYSPGLVLDAHVMREWLCAGVPRTYDLGWGSDAYKHHWRPTEWTLSTFVDKGPAGLALLATSKARDLATRATRPDEAARRERHDPVPEQAPSD